MATEPNGRSRPGKPVPLSRLLFKTFKLSHQSMVRAVERPVSFSRWAKLKIVYDSRMTRQLFGFYADQPGKIFDANEFGTFYFLYRRHLTKRQKLFRMSRRLPFAQATAFIILAYIDAFVNVSLRLGWEVVKLSQIPVLDFTGLPKHADVVIGFPHHAFALSPTSLRARLDPSRRVWFSFGDALAEKTGQQTPLVSIYGYERPSRAREQGEARSGTNPEHLSVRHVGYERKATASFGPTLRVIGRVLRALVSGRALYQLERIRSDTRALRYRRVFAEMRKAGHRIGDVYCLPFDDIGSIRFRGYWRDKIVNVHYSQNTKLAPFEGPDDLMAPDMTREQAHPSKYFAGEMPLYTYFLTGRSIGFTEVHSEAHASKAKLLNRFGLKAAQVDPEQPKRAPMLLGFERLGVTDYAGLAAERPLVAAFDVPPQTIQDNLPRALLGDRVCDFAFIEGFVTDVAEACVATNFRAVLKPKYSLTNSPANYAELLRRMQATHPGHFTVLEPYANMAELMLSVRGVVCFPYTSPHLVATAVGQPAIYYMPEGPQASLFAREGANKTLTRKDDLVAFLRSL